MLKLTTDAQVLNRVDVLKGTLVAIVMGVFFATTGGLPLIVTFIPGLIVAWLVILSMFYRKVELPSASAFVPLFFAVFAWQFLHFNEEFANGFYIKFPELYGAETWSVQRFVNINMVSYFAFAMSCILIYTKKLRFLIVPVMFYIMYGAIANAITHTYWVISFKEYFPGFYTGLAYWVLGPLLLGTLIGSKKTALVITVLFAVFMITLQSLVIV